MEINQIKKFQSYSNVDLMDWFG